MLIPTTVNGYATLAVPGTDYWAGTAAHYYINPPGVSAGAACVWGSNNNPWGNWSPFVAGANQDASGLTYIKLGWNPIYLEQTTPFRNQVLSWGVEIDCPNGGCEGLPCAIDPSDAVNAMKGGAAAGAGGGNFCVVTVNKGSTANFVITGGSGSGSSAASGKGGQFYQWSSTSVSSTSSASSTSAAPTTTATTSSISPSQSHNSTAPTWTSSETYSSSSALTRPSGQPYYSLFNTTAPQSSAHETAEVGATATAAGPAASITIAHHTGSAATISAGFLALMPLAFWALL